MTHVMVDLETLGTTAGSVILSIGAVVFSQREGLGATYDRVISERSCLAAGLTTDPATITWWNGLPNDAQETLKLARCDAAVHLEKVLREFARWLAAECDGPAKISAFLPAPARSAATE